MTLPFVPLTCFLIVPEYFGKIALWVLPALILLAIDNAKLTAKYLSPYQYIENNITESSISHYLSLLSKEVKKEDDEHQSYLDNREKFKIPIHAYEFEPTILGLEPDDIWDSITIITMLSVENNDYPVFRQSIKTILKLVIAFYSFDYKDKDNYRINDGIKSIARNRLRSIINRIIYEGKDRIFLQSLSNELCSFLMEEEILSQPCSELTRAVVSDVVWIGEKMLESDNIIEPIKILNTIHGIIEISIHRIETEATEDKNKSFFEKNYIPNYAHHIKSLGVSALNNGNSHFAYRCLESLSYLGCNAAKLKSELTVRAVFEAIVHLGRVARNLKIGCFWQHCLIPVESHAEEFMNHILTWLVRDIDSNGKFFMKGHAEQAYSRLRGVKCAIKQKAKTNTFWIEELENDGEKTPHVEAHSGHFGYGGKCDYSDFSNLKEFVLHGFV